MLRLPPLGDVDRAVRIVLEDQRTHDALKACEWEFEGDVGWAPFDGDTDAVLSRAFARGLSAAEVVIVGQRYLVDFDSLTQLNLGSKRSRRIRRRGGDSAAASSSSSSAAVAGQDSHECSRICGAASTSSTPAHVPAADDERSRAGGAQMSPTSCSAAVAAVPSAPSPSSAVVPSSAETSVPSTPSAAHVRSRAAVAAILGDGSAPPAFTPAPWTATGTRSKNGTASLSKNGAASKNGIVVAAGAAASDCEASGVTSAVNKQVARDSREL